MFPDVDGPCDTFSIGSKNDDAKVSQNDAKCTQDYISIPGEQDKKQNYSLSISNYEFISIKIILFLFRIRWICAMLPGHQSNSHCIPFMWIFLYH